MTPRPSAHDLPGRLQPDLSSRFSVFCFALFFSVLFLAAVPGNAREKAPVDASIWNVSELAKHTQSADKAFVAGRHREAAAALQRLLEAALAEDTAEALRLRAQPDAHLAISALSVFGSTESEWRQVVDILLRYADSVGVPGIDPLVAAHARYNAGFAQLALGRVEAAEKTFAPLGLLRNWKVIGPFDNERGGGFDEVYPPEESIDFEGEYFGKTREVTWRDIPARALDGQIVLDEIFQPNDECLAYALTFIQSDTERTLALRVGSDEGFRAWINGQPVATDDVERGMKLDQTAARLPLRAGWNVLLLKVAEAKGSWEFIARLTELDGSPAEGWNEAAPGEPTPAPDELIEKDGEEESTEEESSEDKSEEPAPSGGALDIVARLLEASPEDGRLHFLRAALLQDKGAFDIDEHPDTESIRRAIEIDAEQPLYHLLLAQTLAHESDIAAQRDDNAWRAALEKAAELDSASACIELGDYYIDTFENASVAEAWADRAAQLNPDSTKLLQLRDSIADTRGFPSSGTDFLRRLESLEPDSYGVLRRKASRHGSAGRTDERATVLEGLLARDQFDRSARLGLAEIALAKNDVERAKELFEGERILFPFSTGPDLRLAAAAIGRDDFAGAISHYEAALGLNPEDPDLWNLLAAAHYRLGRSNRALSAWDRSLELQPNQPDVRERLEFIRAEEDPFETEFRRDAAEIAKRTFESKYESEEGDASRILLDNHVIEVNTDGTSRQFHQLVFQVFNELGAQRYDSYGVNFSSGEQIIEYKAARVYHPDGGVDEGDLRSFGTGSIGGEPSWRGAWISLPPVAAGDIVEVQYIGEDVVQSFFGDYFGHRELFRDSQDIVEKVFRLRAPENRELYFHQHRFDVEPKKTVDEEAGKTTWEWRVTNVEKVDQEPGMPSGLEVFPVLDISTFEDWNEFSDWYWLLIRKQFEASPEIRRKVEELTSGKDSEVEKIRALYEFVIGEIRYNAWEFGVHGFKPYNASKVFSRRFGDCKDKATLLSVMLAQVGIKAHPVLINAMQSRHEEDLTLPMINHFNHCITYLPGGEDHPEMYLDGTATFHSLEELPSMDRGAKVLVVREDGGSVQDIPWNTAEQLGLDESWTVRFEGGASLSESSLARIRIRVRATGGFAVQVRRTFEVKARRKKLLEQVFTRRFAGATIVEESFSDLTRLDEPVTFEVELTAPSFLTKTPEGLAFSLPTDFYQSTSQLGLLGALEEREQDIIVGNPRRIRMVFDCELPAGAELRSLPEERREETRFGRFILDTNTTDATGTSGKRLRLERLVELTTPRISVGDYAKFRELATSLEQLENEKIIIEN